jgi:hypothetical protein
MDFACNKKQLYALVRCRSWNINIFLFQKKDLAPDCYKLAWRKNQNVAKALHRKRWMWGLHQMTTNQELHQFVEALFRYTEIQKLFKVSIISNLTVHA